MRAQPRRRTRVSDHEFNPCAPSYHADRCATGQKIRNHLSGNRLRIPADTLRDHAMIAGRHDDRFASDSGTLSFEHARKLQRQLL